MQLFLGHCRCIYSIKRSNNLSISLFASESFVEHSHYSLWYFFGLRGFLCTTIVIRMRCVCRECVITITSFSSQQIFILSARLLVHLCVWQHRQDGAGNLAKKMEQGKDSKLVVQSGDFCSCLCYGLCASSYLSFHKKVRKVRSPIQQSGDSQDGSKFQSSCNFPLIADRALGPINFQVNYRKPPNLQAAVGTPC